jgi:hypothetical protein
LVSLSTATKLIPQEDEERIGNESRGENSSSLDSTTDKSDGNQKAKDGNPNSNPGLLQRRLLVVNRHKKSQREKKKKKKPNPSSFSSSSFSPFQWPEKATHKKDETRTTTTKTQPRTAASLKTRY